MGGAWPHAESSKYQVIALSKNTTHLWLNPPWPPHVPPLPTPAPPRPHPTPTHSMASWLRGSLLWALRRAVSRERESKGTDECQELWPPLPPLPGRGPLGCQSSLNSHHPVPRTSWNGRWGARHPGPPPYPSQGRLRLWAPTPAGEAAVWVVCLVFKFAFLFSFSFFILFFFLSFSFFLILRWESPEVQVPGARERGGKNKMNNNEKKKKITPPSVPKARLCPSKW